MQRNGTITLNSCEDITDYGFAGYQNFFDMFLAGDILADNSCIIGYGEGNPACFINTCNCCYCLWVEI